MLRRKFIKILLVYGVIDTNAPLNYNNSPDVIFGQE